MPKYNAKQMAKNPFLQWFFYILFSLILFLVFLSYFMPDMMMAITNQVWAFCGW